jgi:hypothetical protein
VTVIESQQASKQARQIRGRFEAKDETGNRETCERVLSGRKRGQESREGGAVMRHWDGDVWLNCSALKV